MMFSGDAATVENSIGRLLSDDLGTGDKDSVLSATETLDQLSLSNTSSDDGRSPSPPSAGDEKVDTFHLAQTAQNPESINFLQERLTEKPFTSQPLPALNNKWYSSILATPRGVHPVNLDQDREGPEPNSAPRLDADLLTLRDASSPEIDTDISRTSSTSTRGSSQGSTEATGQWSVKGSVQSSVPEEGLAPSIVLQSEQQKKAAATSSEDDDKAARLSVRRLHSILELLETERNYTEDLDLLVHVFFAQLPSLPYFSENGQRLQTVVRNADELLALHRELTAQLRTIVERATAEDAPSDSADRAVVACAETIASLAPRFAVYNEFCARHKEALAHIDTLESRTNEWEQFRQRSAEAAERYVPRADAQGAPPSEVGRSPRAVTQRRLLFRDFFIKPIQRVCLYPILLQTIQKNSPNVGQEELAHAIELMRQVTLAVDRASKQRESALLTEMIGSRLEYTTALSPSLFNSLGECRMAGNLDVLHHHSTLAPLSMPLPIKYYGCFLFANFVLIVKVRRNHMFTARYWFPLAEAHLERNMAHEHFLPNAFRLSVRGHYFEFIASTAKECQLWLSALEEAFAQGPSMTRFLNGAEIPYPCNLSAEKSVAGTSNGDPLIDFFTHRTSATDAASGRGRGVAESPTGEILLRHKSPPRRAAIDRGMLFSDACISARASFDHEGAFAPAPSSTLGSTMGAIVNLSRLSGSETVSLKLPSRASTALGNTTTNPPHNSTQSRSSDVTPIDSPTGTAPSSPIQRAFFTLDDGSEASGRGFRRRMRDSFSRRSSVQLDANEIAAARELASGMHSLSRSSSQLTLDMRSVASVTELGQTVPGGVPLSIDTLAAQSPTHTPRASQSLARTVRNPKGWFSPTTPRASYTNDDGDPWPYDDTVPAGTLKRSSSLNWSALRSRSWSTTSLKGLVSRRSSMDLDRDMPSAETRGSSSEYSDQSRPGSALSVHADALASPTSRTLGPKRKFAMRFLQRNRLSPMAPTDTQGSGAPANT